MQTSKDVLINKILDAKNIVLSTHRKCDGDGLGSEVALFHALKKMGKKVRVVNVDGAPEKYSFIGSDKIVENFESKNISLKETDLVLILDTNDRRLIEPLYQQFVENCDSIYFIDHHPILSNGPAPSENSWIDSSAASTGELAYALIQGLNIELDKDIARALYTSIAFDTHLFRYIRNSWVSHEIAANLLKQDFDALEVHRCLFGNFSAAKLKFLAQALSQVELFIEDKIAILNIRTEDLVKLGLTAEDSRDLTDMLMNIQSLESAVVIREDKTNQYKVSLRSKGVIRVNDTAELIGGGGHPYASGATYNGTLKELQTTILKSLTGKLEK